MALKEKAEIQGDIKDMLQIFIALIDEIENERDEEVLKDLIESCKINVSKLSNYDPSKVDAKKII